MMLRNLFVAVLSLSINLSACAGEEAMPSEINFIHNESGSLIVFEGESRHASIGISRKPDMMTVKTDSTKFAIKWDSVCYLSYQEVNASEGLFLLAKKIDEKCEEIPFGNILKSTWDKLSQLYGADISFRSS